MVRHLVVLDGTRVACEQADVPRANLVPRASVTFVQRKGHPRYCTRGLSLLAGENQGDACAHTVKFRKYAPALIFSKALFEGIIFGGGYMWRGLSMEGNLRFKINWESLKVGRKFTVFALFYFVVECNFQVQAPGGLIFGGAI